MQNAKTGDLATMKWKPTWRLLIIFIASSCCLRLSTAHASLWDRDTLPAVGATAQPTIGAVIFGRTIRHTRKFYLLRIVQVRKKMRHATTAQQKALLDDWAVANDRVHREAFAIDTMLSRMQRFGVDFRAAANLGTFYQHSGDTLNAALWIGRSLKLGPAQQTAREWVQLHEIGYRLAGSKGAFFGRQVDDLVDRLAAGAPPRPTREAVATGKLVPPAALEGMLSLVAQTDRDDPTLYAALAQLLILHGEPHLAALAYLRAADVAEPADARRAAWQLQIQQLCKVLPPGADNTEAAIRASFQQQLAFAGKWRHAYADYEQQLLAAGKDPTVVANLAPFYQRWGSPLQEFKPVPTNYANRYWLGLAIVCIGGAAWWRKRSHTS